MTSHTLTQIENQPRFSHIEGQIKGVKQMENNPRRNTMKKQIALALIAAAVLGTGATVQAQGCGTSACETKVGKKAKAQTTCPVMGGKIDKSQYADVNGKRIYVCCPACVAKVKANPDQYTKKLEAEGVKIAKTPKKTVSNEHDHAPIKGYAEHEKH